MPRKYGLDALDNVLEALDNAPPPDKEKVATTRDIMEKAFEKIDALSRDGHTFEQISGILSGVGVEIAPSTIAAYVREIRNEREKEARRQRRLEKKNGKTVDSPSGKTPIQAKPALDVIHATIEDGDDDEIQ